MPFMSLMHNSLGLKPPGKQVFASLWPSRRCRVIIGGSLRALKITKCTGFCSILYYRTRLGSSGALAMASRITERNNMWTVRVRTV